MTHARTRSILAVLAFLTLLAAGCAKQPADPLTDVFDLRGVPVSPEMAGHLAAGLDALAAPEPDAAVTRLLDRAQALEVAIQRRASRAAAVDSLWAAWRGDPANLVWIHLTTRYRYYAPGRDPFADMLRHPALADSTGAAGAFLRGRLSYSYEERAAIFDAAEDAAAELDSLQRVVLDLNLAYEQRGLTGDLGAAERLLDGLPLARRTGGVRLEAECWYDIAGYLQAGDRLDDALHAAVLATAMARKLDDPYLSVKRRIRIADIMQSRRESYGALELLETCLTDAGTHDYEWGLTAGLDKAASICCDLRDYGRAVDYDRRNLAHAVADADSQNVPRNLASLSYDYRMLGHLDSTKVCLEEARRWVDAFPDPINAAQLPLYEAEYFCQVGDYETAVSLLEEARTLMWDASLVDDFADMLLDHIRMGLEMGHADLAYRAIDRLRTMPEALRDKSPNQNRLADFEILSADLLARQGEFRAAAAAQVRAREAVALRGGEGKAWECRRSEGELSLLRGDLDAARASFAAALALAETEGNPSRLLASRFHLGHVLLELGQGDEARALFAGAAADTAYGGRFRTRLSAELMHAMSYAREDRHAEAVARYRALLDRCTPHTPADLLARLHIELGRSLLRIGEIEVAEESLETAFTLLEGPARRTQVSELRAFNRTALRDAAELLIGLYVDHTRVDTRARRTLLVAEAVRANTARADLDEDAIHKLIDGDGFVVSYFVGRDRSFRWLDDRIVLDLPGRAELLQAIAPVAADLERPGRPVDEDAVVLLSRATGLMRIRWSTGLTLRIVPDDILFAVPWSALHLIHCPVAIDHITIHEAPSLTTLARRSPARPADTLRLLTLGHDGPAGDSDVLHHAEAEARAVAALWPPDLAEVRVGPDAGWTTLAGARPPDVIHIASHTVIHQGAPGRSTLRLASDTPPLTPDTVRKLSLDAELVFLSCCETAGRAAGAGRGLADFARAFMDAGARTVIASTLRVDDEAAAFLAERFYLHWLNGESKARALRAAQLEVRGAHPEWGHPYYWASFRLIGDGG